MKSTRDAFGYQLPVMGKQNNNIICLDADLAKATKMDSFAKSFPDRFFEIGIAECNMIGIASGLSEYGYKVFISSFSSFLTGKYDVIRCSIGYSNAPVVMIGTHGGMAIGKDGVTQMGLEDIGLMRAIPGMVVLNPSTYTEAVEVIKYVCENELKSPHYVRLGRQPIVDVTENYYSENGFEFGKGVVVKDGSDITMFSTGCILPDVVESAKLIEDRIGKSVRIINFHTLKPIDETIIKKCAIETNYLFTVEDHSIVGGLGSIVSEVLVRTHPVKLTMIGLNDVFPESGEPSELYEKYGLSVNKIVERVVNELG